MNNVFAFLPMRVSNELLDDPQALRDRLAADGYLYLQQVLDRPLIAKVRRDILGVTQRLGWTEPGALPRAQRCIVAPLREEDEEFIAGYQEIQRLQSFHELAHDAGLMAVMRTVLGESAFPHPLKIARVSFPGHYEASTPPHQDFPNNQGTPDLTAAWIPVGDMPPELGGLAILRGSHRWGLLPLAGHIGAGNRCAVIPPEMAESCRWVTTSFAMGDVLLFPALTVHAALHNASEFHLRLSVDFRYQLEGQALTAGCLQPHFQQISWDEVYEGWTSATYQRYWEQLDYEVVPFQPMPIEGGGGSQLSKEDFGEIMRYEERVKARTARRLTALGIDDEGARPRRSTTFDRHQDEPVRSPARP